MKKLVVLTIFMLLSGPVLSDELAPFLYYEAEDGYVIERADGTDSHIVGQRLTLEPWQRDASWSSSGAWLAWRGLDPGGCGLSSGPVTSLYLVREDSEHRFRFQNAVYDWSDTEDLLVVVKSDKAGVAWQVRDPIEVIASGPLPEFADATMWDFPDVVWVGDTAIVSYETQIVLIHPDYTVTKTTLPADVLGISPQGEAIFLSGDELVALNLLTQTERHVKTETKYIENIEWAGSTGLISSSERWFYLSPDQFQELSNEWMWVLVREGVAAAKSEEEWVVHDFITGTQRTIDFKIHSEVGYEFKLEKAMLSADENWIAYIEDGPVMIDLAAGEMHHVGPTTRSFAGNWGGYTHWHPTENWLIAEEEGVAGCGSSFYTQVTNGTERYEIPCSIDCAHWLPERVNPSVFPVYEKPDQPVPVKVLYASGWVTDLVWSGNILQSQENYYNSKAEAWDVTTEAEVPPLTLTPVDYSGDEWEEFGHVSAVSEHYVVGRYLYNRQTKEPVFTEPKIYSEFGLVHYLTPDERFLVSGGAVEPLKIWSIPDGTIVYQGMAVTAAALSPDGEYVAVGLGWDIAIYELDALLKARRKG